mgnify:CR=1 FL=1
MVIIIRHFFNTICLRHRQILLMLSKLLKIFRLSVDNADPIVCELLEGTPRTTIPTAILSTPKPKPTNQPTKRQINPTFTAKKPGLLSSVNVQSSSLCSNNSHYDVKYFKTDRNRIRNCLWFSRKCWKRCVDFAECCPQSCSTSKCQR